MQQLSTITWDSLYSELVAFVYPKVKDRPTAEDIVQDVFIKVHTKSHQIKEADKITAWIYQITRNAITDHFRKSSKVLHPVNMDWESNEQEFNDCVAYCLEKLLRTLPEKYRTVLELTELENMSQQEVAMRLKISYPGARSRVQRARKMLKERLNELYYVKTDYYGNVIVCENRVADCCQKEC